MGVSISAVDKSAVDAFTKIVLYCYAIAQDDLPASSGAYIKTLGRQSVEFLDRFSIRKPIFKRVVAGLATNEVPDGESKFSQDLEDFLKIVRTKAKSFEAEPDVPKLHMGLMRDTATAVLRDSEPAAKRLTKNVAQLQDNAISILFSHEVANQDGVGAELAQIVKSITGKEGMLITTEERTKAKRSAKKTALLKQYTKLRSQFNQIPNQFLQNYIRDKGVHLISVNEAKRALKSAGIKHHPIVEGFDGFVGEDLSFYTKEKRLLKQKPAGKVEMNPEYDGTLDNTYVFKMQTEFAQKPTLVYTTEYSKRQTSKKYEDVRALSSKLDQLRRKWRKTMNTEGTSTRDGICAVLCELVYQTSGRIGSPGNKTDNKPTYGLSTLLVSHYKKRGADRIISYRGKAGQDQNHKLSGSDFAQADLIDHMDALARGKKRGDSLFTVGKQRVSRTALSRYMKSIGFPNNNIHKFRTMHGTQEAAKVLAANPFKNRSTQPTSKQVNDWVAKALESIAKKLGHFKNGKLTIATAIGNYIDPSILDDFYKSVGVRPSTAIEKAIKAAKD